MGDWQNTAAGAGLTGGLIALLWGGVKLLKRSKCASHTRCCDLDIARAETERRKKMDIQAIVLDVLAMQLEKKPEEEQPGAIGGDHQI